MIPSLSGDTHINVSSALHLYLGCNGRTRPLKIRYLNVALILECLTQEHLCWVDLAASGIPLNLGLYPLTLTRCLDSHYWWSNWLAYPIIGHWRPRSSLLPLRYVIGQHPSELILLSPSCDETVTLPAVTSPPPNRTATWCVLWCLSSLRLLIPGGTAVNGASAGGLVFAPYSRNVCFWAMARCEWNDLSTWFWRHIFIWE